MATKIITNFIAKQIFKQKGVIGNSKSVDFSANALEERLKRLNIDPNEIKSEGELNQILSFVKQAEDQAFTDRFGSMLKGSRFGKQGDVVDMTGKKLDPNKGIMGGTQTTEKGFIPIRKDQIQDIESSIIKENLMKTDNPFTELVKATEKGPMSKADRLLNIDKSLRGKKVPTTFSEDIERQYGLTLQGDETVQEVIDMINDLKAGQDFATGGRAGFAMGLGPRFIKFLNETNPIELYKRYLQSVKKRAQEGDVKSLAPELGAVGATGILVNRRMKDVLENMKNQDMENNLENFKKELDVDPFYKEYPEIKDKVLENYVETMFGEKKAEGGRIGFDMGGAPSIVLNPEERKMGKVFETDKVEEAIKEIIKRGIPTTMAEIPLSEKGRLRFGFDGLSDKQISGGLDLLGGELNFGAGEGRQGRGVGFEFRKRFDEGGMSRRKFMKIMGGIATLPILGKYIKPAMPLIKKGAEITGPALDKIIETVMSAGKLISQSGKRLKELTTRKKLKDVEVEEDMMNQSYTIKTKDKTIYYKPGRQDEMGIDDDIIEVVEDTVTKKAGGGIARMLGE